MVAVGEHEARVAALAADTRAAGERLRALVQEGAGGGLCLGARRRAAGRARAPGSKRGAGRRHEQRFVWGAVRLGRCAVCPRPRRAPLRASRPLCVQHPLCATAAPRRLPLAPAEGSRLDELSAAAAQLEVRRRRDADARALLGVARRPRAGARPLLGSSLPPSCAPPPRLARAPSTP
jgi:hypothetical protein